MKEPTRTSMLTIPTHRASANMRRPVASFFVLAVLLVCTFGVGSLRAQSNVGIGTTAPNSSAILDLTTTTMGLLIPRMTTIQKNAISSPATGLLVWDNSLSQFYYYNGSAWVPFNAFSTGWSTLGNAGTVAGTNFLGTTDAVALRFRTNNIDRMGITSTGNVGIGNVSPNRPFEVTLAAPGGLTTGSFRSATAGYGVMLGAIGDTSTYGVIQGFGPGNVGADLVFQSTLSGGHLGVNTEAPNTMLDVNGDFALRDTTITLVNGVNSNVSVGGYSFIRIVGPSAAFSVTGLSGGVDGKIVILYNTTTQNMTITNDATSTVGNRIYTMSGANIVTTGTGTITMIYSLTDTHWITIATTL